MYFGTNKHVLNPESCVRESSVTLSTTIAVQDGQRQQSVTNELAGVGSIVRRGTALPDHESW